MTTIESDCDPGLAPSAGSIGMADSIAGASIGYVMNRMGSGVLLNARGQALVDQSLCFSGLSGR